MTDPEKRAVSERLATLAEAAGLPTELVYLQYWECSDGHINPVKFEPMYCFQTLPHTVNNTVSCRKPVHPIMVGRDLTDTAVLLPLVEAYCAKQDMGYDMGRYAMREYRDDDGSNQIAQPTHFASVGYHAKNEWVKDGTDAMECLAQALCAAMESEKGASS